MPFLTNHYPLEPNTKSLNEKGRRDLPILKRLLCIFSNNYNKYNDANGNERTMLKIELPRMGDHYLLKLRAREKKV